MSKTYTTEPYKVILSALEKLEAYIAPTYGPAGRGILVDHGEYQEVLDDGFLAIDEFELPDPLENAVIKLVKEVSAKTNKRAGDGTTTSTLLMIGLVREIVNNSQLSFYAAFRLLQESLPKVLAHLATKKCDISTVEELTAIARNAYDDNAAVMIAQTVHDIGPAGVVSVQEGDTLETTYEIRQGMSFDRGAISPHMVNKTLTKPAILVSAMPIDSMASIYPVLDSLIKEGIKDVLIVADRFSGDTLPSIVMSNSRGALNCVCVEAPYQGQMKREFLEDLAIVTGGIVVDDTRGDTLKGKAFEYLGDAESVMVSDTSTLIIGGNSDSEEIAEYAAKIKSEGRDGFNELRIARLTAGIARIKVGAATEGEMKHKKAKIDDAVNAAQLALKSGVVPGGATSFLAQTGNLFIDQALWAPRNVLLANNIDALLDTAEDAYGVVQASVESAFSMAALLLNTGGIITDGTEKRQP